MNFPSETPFELTDPAGSVGGLPIGGREGRKRLKAHFDSLLAEATASYGGPWPDWCRQQPPRRPLFGLSLLYNAFLAGIDVPAYIAHRASTPGVFQLVTGVNEQGLVTAPTLWLPGHTEQGNYGPTPSPVMLVSKMPWVDEEKHQRLFAGESGQLWKRKFAALSVNYASWYMTNAIKFKPPTRVDRIPVSWFDELRPFLMYEISVVRPSMIICMGADAVRMFYGDKVTLSETKNRELTYQWFAPDDPKREIFSTRLITMVSPEYALRDLGAMSELDRDIRFVADRLSGDRAVTVQSSDYRVIDTCEQLDHWINERVANDDRRFAIDCEWSGEKPQLDPSVHYLRSIQFCWAPGKAVYLRLYDENGKPVLASVGRFTIADRLKRLLFRPGVAWLGHNIRSDLPWIEDLGVEGVELDRIVVNGHDTMLASHVLDETQPAGLEVLAAKYTTFGRYDWELNVWKRQNKKLLAQFGYGRVPDAILIPYACIDVEVVWAAVEAQIKELTRIHVERCNAVDRVVDEQGITRSPASLFYDTEQAVTPAIRMVERNGIYVDRERMMYMVNAYTQVRDRIESELRKELRWPNFNPRSNPMCRDLLFRDVAYKGKKPSTAPPGAVTFNFTPIASTGKGHGTPWDRIERDGQQQMYAPSTADDTLKIICRRHPHPALKLFADFRRIDQVCKNFLREPVFDDQTGDEIPDGGLLSAIDPDNRIRTTITQLIDTGRYGSRRPNLQNIPSRQEKELKKIAATHGFTAMPSMRSCFTATPGWLLVSSDYRSAELVVMAFYSGDLDMQAAVTDRRRDLHIETANDMFQLGLKLVGIDPAELERLKDQYKTERIQGKVVNFSIPYGLGAAGLAIELEAEGIEKSIDACQELLDKHQEFRPVLHRFLNDCAAHVTRPPYYFETVFGRRRHFVPSTDEAVIASQQRQAKNMPIQSVVADSLSRALIRSFTYLRTHPDAEFRLILPVHDQIIFEVRPRYLRYFIENVLTDLMCVPIPRLNIRLEADREVTLRWGEKPARAELEAIGVSPEDIHDFIKLRDDKN